MFVKTKRTVALIFTAIVLLFTNSIAYAQGEKNSSDGISGQKPLSFLSITLTDGNKAQDATDVPTEPRFVLQFDKNVVNSTLWENNRKCFSLVSQGNENIPISVTKVDDTIDFTQRQNVFIQSVNPLRPGTSYFLKISPDLRAKNGFSTLGGTTNGQGVTISFKTVGRAEQNPVAQPSGLVNGQSAAQPDNGKKQLRESASSPGNADSNENIPDKSPGAASAGDEREQPSLNQQQTKPGNPVSAGAKRNWPVLFPVALMVGWVAVEVYLKRKKK